MKKYEILQGYRHGFTKHNSATSGDLMAMEASVGEEYHRNCVLLLDRKLSTTEMIQMDGLVVVECSGEYSHLMLNHGL